MIDPKELRIGNWVSGFVVSEAYTTGNVRVEMICPGSVDRIGQGYDVVYYSQLDPNRPCILKFENIIPITLTPEILKRCGFSCSFGDWYKIVNEEEKHVLEFKRKEGWCFDELQLYNEPEYLHQLQNLYFALTGEELEIKEAAFVVNK